MSSGDRQYSTELIEPQLAARHRIFIIFLLLSGAESQQAVESR